MKLGGGGGGGGGGVKDLSNVGGYFLYWGQDGVHIYFWGADILI